MLLKNRALIEQGAEIKLHKWADGKASDRAGAVPLGTRLRLCHTDGTFFALGEVVESDEGLALKAIKTFVL